MSRQAEHLPICALALLVMSIASAGCHAPEASAWIEAAASQPSETAVPPEIAAVATTVLGQGAEVVAFGDLAHNGHQQVLVANQIGVVSEAEPGIRFTRAAMLERTGTKWAEVLRCDEYLKNPDGYLGGARLEPVTGWRLEWSGQGAKQQRELLFTPLKTSGATSMTTVTVRWNPSVKRYQSVDQTTGRFFAEVPSLSTPESPLR